MDWHLMVAANGDRIVYWGSPVDGAIRIPSRNAANWKWSDGRYCFA
jgi:hypothetical protein